MTYSKLKKLEQLFLLFIAISSCNILTGCTEGNSNNEQEKNLVTLPIYLVDTGTAIVNKNFLGTIEGKVNVEIRPQVSGAIEDIYVDEGAYVEKGQALFKIHSQPYVELLNNALANEKVELAKLENANIEVKRLKPLVENEVISEVRMQKANSEYALAKASLDKASAAVASAKINLEFTIIKAPVSGYIGRLPKRIGNLVNSGDKEPLTYLSDINEVYVYFSISESDYLSIYKGSLNKKPNKDSLAGQKPVNVSLILADGTTYPYQGNIDGVTGQVNKSTGALSLRASFPNDENILRSGNTGTLKMEEIYPGVILIPQLAISSIQDKSFVMILDASNRVKRQIIQIAGSSEDKYIISSGLKPSDRIILEGFDRISEGMLVQPLAVNTP